MIIINIKLNATKFIIQTLLYNSIAIQRGTKNISNYLHITTKFTLGCNVAIVLSVNKLNF